MIESPALQSSDVSYSINSATVLRIHLCFYRLQKSCPCCDVQDIVHFAHLPWLCHCHCASTLSIRQTCSCPCYPSKRAESIHLPLKIVSTLQRLDIAFIPVLYLTVSSLKNLISKKTYCFASELARQVRLPTWERDVHGLRAS